MVKMLTVKSGQVSEPFAFNMQQQISLCHAVVHESGHPADSGSMVLFAQALCQPFSDVSAMEREPRANSGICWLIAMPIVTTLRLVLATVVSYQSQSTAT